MKAHISTKDGHFHRHLYPKARKEHEISLQVNSGPSPFSEGRYFLTGLVHPRDMLPGSKSTKDSVPLTLVHNTGSCREALQLGRRALSYQLCDLGDMKKPHPFPSVKWVL